MHSYKLAVFGHPIAHSRSPAIHALFAKQAGIALSYEKIDPGVDGFIAAMRAFSMSGAQGFNVTMPFKQQAYTAMDRLLPRAQAAGAVNTVKVMADGQLLGDNTDGDGLVQALQLDLAYSLSNKQILILGAGGAVKGILPALLAAQPAHITIMNRTMDKAKHMVDAMDANDRVTPLPLDAQLMTPIDLLIHAAAFDEHSWPAGLTLAPRALVYDLRYGETAQAFVQYAKTRGAAYGSDGLSMLVCQAALAFTLWTGFLPDVMPVLSQLRDVRA